MHNGGFDMAAHRVLDLAVRKMRAEHGVRAVDELDLGGGFGIAYVPQDDPADVKVVAQSLQDIVRAQCTAAGLEMPRLTVEPGRGSPGRAPLPMIGTVSVNSGMSDNIRTACRVHVRAVHLRGSRRRRRCPAGPQAVRAGT